MSSDFAALALEQDFEEARATPDAARWKLEKPGPLEVLVTMSSEIDTKNPKEAFQARLLWARYPEDPPSLKYRDPATGRLDQPSAWPIVRGFRPQSLDACVNYCSEGMQLHPEWRTDPRFMWIRTGNPLLLVLRTLQSEMDQHYSGRFGK